MIRVFLADNRVIFREGMHFILDNEPDVEVVGEGVTFEEALAFLREAAVDVLVLNADMWAQSRPIAREFPSLGFVFVDNARSLGQPVSGNSAFLSRDMESKELVDAIRKVSRDNMVTSAHPGVVGMEQAIRSHLLSLVESL